jgi:hypothetical protein
VQRPAVKRMQDEQFERTLKQIRLRRRFPVQVRPLDDQWEHANAAAP